MLRIFSKSNDLSFNDYIKNIKGKTILSNLKTNNSNNRSIRTNNNKIVSYLSYNDFLVITQTFYKFSNLKKNYKPPQKIIDLKTSFIFYNKFLNHIKDCHFCKTNSIETFFENCKEIKNILYPYGEYFTYEIYSNLASVDLDYWCKKECINHIYCDSKNNENSQTDSGISNELNKYLFHDNIDADVSYKMPVNYPQNISSCNNSCDTNEKNNTTYIIDKTHHSNNSKITNENEEKLFKSTENNSHTDNSNKAKFIFINSSSLTMSKNTFNIFIAELSNSKEYIHDKTYNEFEYKNKQYNFYNFIPIYINFDELKKMFYHSSTKYFNISDVISAKIKLTNQYFENINNKKEPFIMSNSIKKIYIENNNNNEMDANTLIEIEKETNNYFSLYDFNYIKNSLNLEELVYTINSNNIQLGSEIKIRIKVYYKSQKIDIPCIMYFNYIIKDL
jgi:hypothetical protein